MFRRAIHVGAKIEHIGCTALGRQDGTDGRPVDAGQCLQHEAGNRHQRTGITGRHRGVSRAVLDQISHDAHRRVFLAAQGAGNRLIHGNDFRGVTDHEAASKLCRHKINFSAQLVLAADQNGRAIRIPPKKIEHSRQRYRRTVVAAHAIHRKGDRHVQLCVETFDMKTAGRD